MDAFERLPPDAITINFLEDGRSDSLPDGWVHDKVAPATIIAVVRRGRYEVQSEGRTTFAEEGEAFLAQDRQPLCILHHGRRSGEAMQAHWLHARFMLFHTVDLVSLFELPPKLDGRAAAPFAAVIEELASLRSGAGNLAACAKKIELGFRTLSLLGAGAPLNAAGAAVLERADRLAPVLTFIHQHLRESLGIDDLARAAHMSRSRFFAFFQKHMGRAPIAYLKEVRLEDARKRLLASDAKLAAIAEATGFANPFHLSRELKRHLGVTPAEFRRRHRTLEV
jgi:AraC-like DNA-binding protein